jgi:hypothetical protein
VSSVADRPEQRHSPRRRVGLSARVFTGAAWVEAHSRDLSRGGVCLVVEQPVPVGTVIGLQLRLVFAGEGESEPLELRARVVWCTAVAGGHQIGASLVETTPTATGYLDAFLHFLEQQPVAEAAPGPKKGGLFE